MIINHNVPALGTYNQLTKNNAATSKSLGKLSSGLRINSAADDASGLAISEKMRAQIRGLDQGKVNSQDAISLVQTAEGNLAETEDILQRMRELADSAANDTKVTGDRDEIQKELNQLTNEINRIGNTTEFNTMKLLNGGGTETQYNVATPVVGGAVGKMGALNTQFTGVSEAVGTYTVTVGATQGAGANIVVGGQAFVMNGGSATDSAAELTSKMQGNKELSDHYTIAVSGSVITLTEKTGEATGKKLTATGGKSLTTSEVTASTAEVSGVYSFTLDKTYQRAGQTITVDGVTLTATAADTPGVGEFKISADKDEQAKSIAGAINSQATLGANYIARAENGVITITQRKGKAKSTAPADPVTPATAANALNKAQAGKYSLDINTLVKAGGKVSINDVDIAVVDDATDARLSTGEAILASQDKDEQARRLKAAINSNSNLKDLYTADVASGKVTLEQKAGKESLVGPKSSSNTSSTDGFEAKMQIGANSYQSMTVKVNDMRALALGITGEKAGAKVTAKGGAVAQYTATKNVNNGTDDANVEYALDLSTHERATAAISVIDDAIQSVSAERSRLGAYQNRLEHTINNLGTSSQNMTEAESRIRDTDMAKEMMSFQKNNILSQAAQSMLAQANQLPQGVLQLLR